jgi:hypothetical protein
MRNMDETALPPVRLVVARCCLQQHIFNGGFDL